MKSHYFSEVQLVDFDRLPETVQSINDWIEEETSYSFDDVIESGKALNIFCAEKNY